MILGFSRVFPWGGETLFKEKINSGIKIHTVRRDENSRWAPGKQIEMAYGVRTKGYEQFNSGRCSEVYPIIINPENERVFIQEDQGRVYRYEGVLAFAKNDGFDSLDDFWKWFNKPFEGKLISWTLYENGKK